MSTNEPIENELKAKRRKMLWTMLKWTVSLVLLAFVLSMVNLYDQMTTLDGAVLRGRILNPGEIDLAEDFTVRIRLKGSGEVHEVPRREISGAVDRIHVRSGDRTEVVRGVIVNRRDAAEANKLIVQLFEGQRQTIPMPLVLEVHYSNLDGLKRGVLYIAARLHWGLTVLAVIPFFFPVFFTGIRFRLLLKAQGIDITLLRSIRLTWLGLFFNNISFGVNGGDLVKAAWVYRETARSGPAVLVVFLDRLIGLVTMIAIATIMSLFLLGNAQLGVITYVLMAVLGSVVLFAALFFSRRVRGLLRVEKIVEKLPGHRFIKKIDEAVFLYRDHPGKVALGVVLSAASQCSMFFGLFLLSRAMSLTTPMRYFFVFPPVINIISSLPINVAGWGVGEWLYVKFFGLVGVGAGSAVSLSILFRLFQMVLASLPGVFMLNGRSTGIKDMKKAAADYQAVARGN